MPLEAAPETRSTRLLYARIAGAAYLAIVLAALAYGGLVESHLIVPGNDAVTAANILADPLRSRACLCCAPPIASTSTVWISLLSGM